MATRKPTVETTEPRGLSGGEPNPPPRGSPARQDENLPAVELPARGALLGTSTLGSRGATDSARRPARPSRRPPARHASGGHHPIHGRLLSMPAAHTRPPKTDLALKASPKSLRERRSRVRCASVRERGRIDRSAELELDARSAVDEHAVRFQDFLRPANRNGKNATPDAWRDGNPALERSEAPLRLRVPSGAIQTLIPLARRTFATSSACFARSLFLRSILDEPALPHRRPQMGTRKSSVLVTIRNVRGNDSMRSGMS